MSTGASSRAFGALTLSMLTLLPSTPAHAASDALHTRLVDQRGHDTQIAEFSGRPVVVTFVATRCTDACPIANAAFAALERRLKRDHVESPHALRGMAMLLSGAGTVRTQAAIIPFSVEEMDSGKVHMVMNSEDYLEPGTSIAVMYASAGFHDGSPKLYAAMAAAFEDAFDFIHQHPHEAAEIYVGREPQKHDLGWIEAMIADPKMITYESTPIGLKKHADFMFAAGTLKRQPASWKDLVWDNMWGKDGS